MATIMSQPTPPLAVLWDFDGSLVDTEPCWHEAEERLMARWGVPYSQDLAESLTGMALVESAELMRRYAADHGYVPTEDPEEVTAWMVQEVAGIIRSIPQVPWRPGVPALLEELRAHGIPLALVSASYRDVLDAVLHRLPGGTFDAVVGGDDVTRGKPDPQPYELAASMLDVDPADCIAIEDSVPGIASAEAAGAVVVAVKGVRAHEPGPRRVYREDLSGMTLAELRVIWASRG